MLANTSLLSPLLQLMILHIKFALSELLDGFSLDPNRYSVLLLVKRKKVGVHYQHIYIFLFINYIYVLFY